MFIGTPCISLLNSNYRRRVPKVLRLLWVMVIFRFVVHLLNVICFKLWSLYIWYNVDTVLYQFLETGTSDNTQIGHDQLPKCLGFNLHHHSFYLNSPVISINICRRLKMSPRCPVRTWLWKYHVESVRTLWGMSLLGMVQVVNPGKTLML